MADSHLPVVALDRDKLELIKNTICKGATDDELALFKYICERRQLDPFARQIYALKRKVWNSEKESYDEVMTIQTAIDGFRLIAARSGHYAGQLGPFFTDDGEKWLDCWVKDTPPKASKVAVLRDDFREPIWAMARFKAYCPINRKGEPTGQWRTMPDGQIAKCAEALALRRAFPEELSGMYASEEMHQAQPIVEDPDFAEVEKPLALKMDDAEIERRANADPDAQLTDEKFWEGAKVVEPPVASDDDDTPASNEQIIAAKNRYDNLKWDAKKKAPRIKPLVPKSWSVLTVGQTKAVHTELDKMEKGAG